LGLTGFWIGVYFLISIIIRKQSSQKNMDGENKKKQGVYFLQAGHLEYILKAPWYRKVFWGYVIFFILTALGSGSC
jgi:uncharacterized membrane protein